MQIELDFSKQLPIQLKRNFNTTVLQLKTEDMWHAKSFDKWTSIQNGFVNANSLNYSIKLQEQNRIVQRN